MERLIKNLDEMQGFAKEILQKIEAKDGAVVLALTGDLGSGKTAFTKELGKLLKVKEEILSPTFVIMKLYDISYKNFKKLIHIDAYRIEDPKELQVLGFEEILKNKENLIVIEWPEMVAPLIGDDAIKIKFEFIDENNRRVTL